jgi:hypothetical protein
LAGYVCFQAGDFGFQFGDAPREVRLQLSDTVFKFRCSHDLLSPRLDVIALYLNRSPHERQTEDGLKKGIAMAGAS